MEENGFELVTKGHRLCAKRHHTRSSHDVLTNNDDQVGLNKDTICERIRQRKGEEPVQNYAQYIQAIFEKDQLQIEEIIVYGIGKLVENISAQYQIAVLLLLMDSFPKVRQVLVYDPVLTPLEINALEQLGLHDIGVNEHCRHTVTVPTLFYMPHCGLAMYNNLLYANWSPEELTNVVIIGNNFSNYFTRLTSRELSDKGLYLSMLKDVVVVRPFPFFFEDNVFNDTALHLFPKLKTLHLNAWTQHSEPVLDPEDQELKL